MIHRVEGPDDPRLALYRFVGDPHGIARAGFFVVESRLVLPRLLGSRYRTHSVLVSPAALEPLRPLLEARADVDVLVASAKILGETGSFAFHRGCLALGYRGEQPEVAGFLGSAVATGAPLVLVEDVSNPDNIGGLFRSAHAFAAAGVLLSPTCADPLYRKAIRTSMGATLDLPWTQAREWPSAIEQTRAAGYRVVALTTGATAAALEDVVAAASGPLALLLGSEGFGLSPEAIAAADVTARIPMANADADSLNVAVAGAIGLYEVRRVRRVR